MSELSLSFIYREHILSKVGKIKTRDICILFKVLCVTPIIIKGSCLWGMKMGWRERLWCFIKSPFVLSLCFVVPGAYSALIKAKREQNWLWKTRELKKKIFTWLPKYAVLP